VDKYKRPPNDELFQTRSWAEWQIEMYEDLYVRRNELKEQMESGEVDHKKALRVLTAIESLLGESATQDTLVDQWEKDLEEGRLPDLEA
jgi:hypothetical protein